MQTQSEIRRLLEAAGLSPLKAFGQNFLIDQNLMAKLLDLACPAEAPVVLEVGPGTGSLTEELLKAAPRLVSVEIDRGLGAMLADRFGDQPNFTLIRGDVLADKHHISPEVLRAVGSVGHLVSNLPYNIAVPLLAQCLIDSWRTLQPVSSPLKKAVQRGEGILPTRLAGVPPAKTSDNDETCEGKMPSPHAGETPTPQTPTPLTRFDRMTVTVQKEVADRLIASPGGGAYGPVSVIIGLLGRTTPGAVVPATSFWPQPTVASRIIRIDFDPAAAGGIRNIDVLGQLLSLAFGQRRKQIGSIIRHTASALRPEALADAMQQAQVTPTNRAEQIAPEQFLTMANAIAESRI